VCQFGDIPYVRPEFEEGIPHRICAEQEDTRVPVKPTRSNIFLGGHGIGFFDEARNAGNSFASKRLDVAVPGFGMRGLDAKNDDAC
jgi:hypothetical protein